MTSVLILGYGNLDRQDDGVAWHILLSLANLLGRDIPSSLEEGFKSTGQSPDLLFTLQLTPDISETIAKYDRVCFVDAHTGSVPEEVHVSEIKAHFQSSPFTHHMTPATCLTLAETIYGCTPHAILISARGYEFGFARSLSQKTNLLVRKATDIIWNWLQET